MIIDEKQAQEIGFQIYQVVFPEYKPTPGRLPPLAVLESIGRIAFKLVAPKVLEMMREPTQAMIEVGNFKTQFNAVVWPCAGSEDASCDAHLEFDSADETWTAMIDKMREDYGG